MRAIAETQTADAAAKYLRAVEKIRGELLSESG
jgi:hypothetical protein